MTHHRFAVVSDIHGNLSALEAVLADIEARKVDRILNLGDHVSGPFRPQETCDLVRQAQLISILGNHDRYLVSRPADQLGPVDRFTLDRLSEDSLDWLGHLPATSYEDGVYMCHGAPENDENYWLERVTSCGFTEPRPVQDVLSKLPTSTETLFLCGHTHLPRIFDTGQGWAIVNPGSVGCPAYRAKSPYEHVVNSYSTAAQYAIVERAEIGWTAVHIAVPYDAREMIKIAVDNGFKDWAEALTWGAVKN